VDSADKLAVAETVYRYATGVDRRDWAAYRSLFADTVTIDFSSFHPDLPPRVMSADDWVAGLVPLFSGLAATQHSMTNPLVAVDGEDPASWFTVGGYYDDTLGRVDGRWLLTGVRLTVTWRAGDPGIMELARAAGNRLLGS
jgi:hypothetical protein